MTNTKKQLKERFDLLPSVGQDAITWASVEEHLRKLSKRHQLHLDQWQELETEVMLALMGIKPINALAANIKAMVRVDDATASALAQDISEVVFAPIRQVLDDALAKIQAPGEDKAGEPLLDLSDEIQKTVRPPSSIISEPPVPLVPLIETPDAVPLTDEEIARELAALDAEHAERPITPDMPADTPLTQPGEIPTSATTQTGPTQTPVTPRSTEKPTVIRSEVPESYQAGAPSSARKDVHNDPYRLPPDV